jgi:hypothetical protein
MPEQYDPLPFCVDHIISQKHHGRTVENNLALACYSCNSFKGPIIAGIDTETGDLTPLFNPRLMRWDDHFAWDGPALLGRTTTGRVTIDVLRINLPERIEHRDLLLREGAFHRNEVRALERGEDHSSFVSGDPDLDRFFR